METNLDQMPWHTETPELMLNCAAPTPHLVNPAELTLPALCHRHHLMDVHWFVWVFGRLEKHSMKKFSKLV